MTMNDFESGLREILINHDKARPLICEGNPLVCEVFIVGINAATEMENDFWSFWSTDKGFNKEEWLNFYTIERESAPLKLGKTRRNKLSSTRQRIEWLVETIKPIRTLETNLFVKATPTANELKKEDRKSLVFEYLLKTIQPKLILIHGNEVIDCFEKLCDEKIMKHKFIDVTLFGLKTKVLAINHLSRGWSKQNSIKLGEKIKSEMKNY